MYGLFSEKNERKYSISYIDDMHNDLELEWYVVNKCKWGAKFM